MTKAKSAPHPFDKEPAEGSRETIDRELARQERKSASGGKEPEQQKSGQQEKRGQ